jgi:hypothetical protein
MARSKKTWRPMKSRKNGLKHKKRIDQNNKILSNFK